MKRILYLTTTDWGWIKQRPHFIAEGLSKYYELTVVGKKVYNRIGHVQNASKVKIHELFRFPFERFSFIKKVNFLLYRLQLRDLVSKADIIWYSNPQLFALSDCNSLKSKLIVYDIMDDILEFPGNKKNQNEFRKIESDERKLFNRADLVFISATHLKEQITHRYGTGNIHVINNAIVPVKNPYKSIRLPEELAKFISSDRIKLTYIGTISAWFDFELMFKILSLNAGIEILLFGPAEIQLPVHKRLKHFGSIEHDYIFRVMQSSDAMIMPFIVNDLIRSVNPVKLYEYIYSKKPCISVYYEELRQFSNYVYFYNDIDELQIIINKLMLNDLKPKANAEEVNLFLSGNTWDHRIDNIRTLLDSVSS